MMTADNTELLAAVLADPADDAIRLVYSDWLEENGQAERAEFIRVQVAIAVLGDDYQPDTSLRDAALCGRERGLFMANGREWFGFPDSGTVAAISDCRWVGLDQTQFVRRGFVAEIDLPAATFLGGPCGWCVGMRCPACHGTGLTAGVAAAMFQAHPIERLVLTDLIQRREYGGGDDRWAVYRGPAGPLWDVLCPGSHPDEFFVEWHDRDAAESAVSAAAVALGRRLASA